MTEQLFSLPVVNQISTSVSQRLIDELPVLVVTHPKVRAAIALQGAHLLSWQPEGEAPVLWMSSASAFKEGVAIRGGIPICWPWFGPAGKPSHGFARNVAWELTDHQETAEGVVLTLTLKSSPETLELWPHEFTLTARFTLGSTCHIELESTGDFEANSALHTYFNIGDIAGVSIKGLGNSFIDKVDGAKAKQEEGDLTFTGQTDRIYTQPQATSEIVDPVLKRTLVVAHENNADVVAWNPGSALSVSMADMPDDGYKTMVCVETAQVSQTHKSTHAAPARLAVTFSIRK
ncbi:D-hexose-6-phosphate mutarotase [Rahnella sp. C60]|jgi:glucose-6-phosphate 1-epimerase|uniref:Putative glucose-6-phosphate 1-epimerase n=1 Tax=Rahnella perminowiae TaxID=2816244 RepID=A0ABS6L293_9GAMM|nr:MULTISPECIES: D-hexose-6-phosphate mutarotase [Rahnella]UJD89266.1 D-hexose-6-phosphate mutarotase [Rahnella aquatilis]MBU9810141.1 D-hexose-6-phosphate mutarotase [Rahnella perminowiae]MBU9817734.1 D-hexose-6-phosphate mutarotase [Rahnella perminowiae]MBU9828183.1 D-hexose-6-phosphate mutarotase [Rahnella perminowiae]MBU9835971.1 D-hexose-6-phosphate mutarotase [Rahnella perminowiae]